MKENFNKKEITSELVKKFLEGDDPQERITHLEYSYQDDFIRVYYRDENDDKCMTKEPFYPFVWAKKSACVRLRERKGNDLNALLKQYGIWVKSLDITNIEGKVEESILDGYIYLFYATRPMSYSKFLEFFKVAGNPIYSDKKDYKKGMPSFTDQGVAKKYDRQYLSVTPQEQYLISTGKRFFKGYDDYDQLLKLTFDLETTGLDTKKDRIIQFGLRFNRPVKYNGEYINFQRIFTVNGNTKEELDASELANIEKFVQVYYTFRPDIVTAHNGESFDWEIIIGACERLGTSLEAISSKYFGSSIYKNKNESILKLGGEIEKYHQTIIPWGITTDSLFAVRRAQALDSNMLRADLKYVTKYSKLVKKNRVYTPGDKISEIFSDKKKHYALNEENGDWYLYDENYVMPKIKADPLKDENYFSSLLEETTLVEKISGTTSTEINTKLTPKELYQNYLNSIVEENDKALYKKGKEGDKFKMYTKNVLLDGYTLVDGEEIITRYLYDDLYECDKVEHRYNTSNFLICKMLPIPFQKCCTMGTAGQWKAMMLAWSYKNNLAIPSFGESKSFTGGLSRLIKVGFVANVAKFDYNSLYPSIILTWAIRDSKDLMGSMLSFLEYVLTEREKYKKLKKIASKNAEAIKERLQNGDYSSEEERIALNEEMLRWKSEESANDKKQLPLKIFGNSFFGSYGAPNVFNWASIDCAERTTCIGRMCLRLMIYWFSSLGYSPIVGDTDGFNFQLPEDDKYRYTEDNPYISSGRSRETKKDAKYVGFKADVAEFNDMFMCDMHYDSMAVNKMGLGIDEIVDSTINFSRKNYADFFPNEPFPDDVKMVGNTIKSKKMPDYISKFLETGVRQLLRQEGKQFLDNYYNYIDKIYNYRIPLQSIASKGKIKKTLEEYVLDCSTITKAGHTKSRQAWMELALRNKLDVHMGQTIYYINTGEKKSDKDTKKVTYYTRMVNGVEQDCKVALEKEYKKNTVDGKGAPEDKRLSFNDYVKKHYSDVKMREEVFLNVILLPQETVDSEIDVFCKDGEEYNVPKYIEQFNNRIKPLLVCFHPDIRDQILVTNPKDKKYFTDEQCKLCSGYPNKPGDQDTFEQLMTMDDKEIRFWLKHPEWEIPFLKECGMDWNKIVDDYNKRMQREKELGIEETRNTFNDIIDNMTYEDFNKFFEDGKLTKSLSAIVDIDPSNGNLVSKEYNDIVIATISDMFDIYDSKLSEMEEVEMEEAF